MVFAQIDVPNLPPLVARLPRTAARAGHLVGGQRRGSAETSNGFTVDMIECVIGDRDDELIDPTRPNLRQ